MRPLCLYEIEQQFADSSPLQIRCDKQLVELVALERRESGNLSICYRDMNQPLLGDTSRQTFT